MTSDRRVLIVDADRAFASSLVKALAQVQYAAKLSIPASAAEDVLEFQPDVMIWAVDGARAGDPTAEEVMSVRPDMTFVAMASRADRRAGRGGTDSPAFINKCEGVEPAIAVVRGCFARRDAGLDDSADNARGLEEAREEANRAKLEFLATVSHELRTPLNAIIGFSDLIMRDLRKPVSDQQNRAYIQDINASGRHLLDVINDILDFAKAEAGKLTLQESEVEVREVVDSIARLVGPRVRDSGVELCGDLPGNLPRLWCDERKLKRMLLNLVSNSSKFTPSGGRIIVHAAAEGDGLAIIVADTGVGIAKADLGRVLEPFVQVESTLNRRHEGTGLGLPLVKAMVEAHGGSLVLESEVGRGTTVRLRFPSERVGRSGDAADGTICPAA